MLPRSLAQLGGPFQNGRLIKDPQTQCDARFYNRLLEDVAQLTRACGFTWFSFVTTTDAAPVTLDASDVLVTGFFGSGDGQKPTVEKTGTGVYELTFPEEFEDGLVAIDNMDTVEETQNVVFTFAAGLNVFGATNGYARVTAIASNVVTVTVYNTSDAANDLGGGITISGYLR